MSNYDFYRMNALALKQMNGEPMTDAEIEDLDDLADRWEAEVAETDLTCLEGAL